MTGREESRAKVEEKIKVILSEQPDYFTDYCNSMSDLVFNSKYQYLCIAIRFAEYCTKRFESTVDDIDMYTKVKASLINRFINEIGTSDSHKVFVFYAVKRFFVYLEMDDLIEKNPFIRLNAPHASPAKEAVSLTPYEIRQLMHNISHPDEYDRFVKRNKTGLQNRLKFKNQNVLLVTMALADGLRKTSLFEIKLEDIDYDEKCIPIIQKGDKIHKAYLTDRMIELIRKWLKDRERILGELNVESDYLFISLDGERMRAKYFDKLLKWATYNIDKHITPHKLRSTCATMLYNETGDVVVASEVLGHSSIKTTQRYIKPNQDKKKKAVSFMEGVVFS